MQQEYYSMFVKSTIIKKMETWAVTMQNVL